MRAGIVLQLLAILGLATHPERMAYAEPARQDPSSSPRGAPSVFAAVSWARVHQSTDRGPLRDAGEGWAAEIGLLWRTGSLAHLELGLRAAWVGRERTEGVIRGGARIELWPRTTQGLFTLEARGGMALGIQSRRLDSEPSVVEPAAGPQLGLGLRAYLGPVVVWVGLDTHARIAPMSTWIGSTVLVSGI